MKAKMRATKIVTAIRSVAITVMTMARLRRFGGVVFLFGAESEAASNNIET